jgi:hypothetical protein
MAKGFPSGSIKNKLNPGIYLFIINVISQNNLMPARFIFKINWDGEWKTLRGSKYIKSFRIYRKPVKSFLIY